MKSRISERTFWSDEGWFIYLRNCDKNLVSYVGNSRLNIRTGDLGVIVGPFISAVQMETWFDSFLDKHASPREIQSRPGELAPDTASKGLTLELLAI